jgi:hypothetical protein
VKGLADVGYLHLPIVADRSRGHGGLAVHSQPR